MIRLSPKRLGYRKFSSAISLVLLLLAVISPAADADTATLNSEKLALRLHSTPKEMAQAEIPELKSGSPLERQLGGGETHTYRVTLSAGQYVKVVADQKGIDLVVRILSPDGRKLTEVNGEGKAETIFTVAEVAGEFRVEVQAVEKEAQAGDYEIRLEELRPAIDKDRAGVAAEKLFEDGNQLRDQQRTAEARRKALLKYEEALPLWRDAGEKAGEAQTLDGMGVTYSALGEPRKAIELYSQALLLWRALGDQLNEATTLTNMGTAYWRLGESQKALESHGQALPLARAAGSLRIEALVLGNTGAVYWSLGQPQEALKVFNQGLLAFQQLGDRRLQAVQLNNIATAYLQLGELQQASETINRAITLRRALGDRPGEAAALNTLGLLYTRLGDLQTALGYYKQALEIRRATGERQWEAVVLQGLSIVHLRLGELELALKEADQSLTLARAVGDRLLEAYVLVVIGKINRLLGEPKKALDNFEQSLSLRRTVGDRYGESYTLSTLGDSYLELGDLPKAADYYRQALKLNREIGDRLGEAATHYGMARVASRAGDNLSARAQVGAALDIIESIRTKVASQDFRSSFFASYQDYYEFTVDLLMRMHGDDPRAGYDAEALQTSERARARSLLETLAEARVDIREGADAALLQRERSLQQQLNAKAERLTRLQSAKRTDDQEAAARAEVNELLDQYRGVDEQLRASSPRYASLTRPQPLSLKEIQRLLEGETVLLKYTLGADRSYLWAVTPNSIESFTLPKRAEVEAQARRVYEALTARNKIVRFEKPEQRRARIAQADAEYSEAATGLSRMVLVPASKLLGKKRLLIVSEGALQYVPFGALPAPPAGDRGQGVMAGKRSAQPPAPNSQPLIVEHEIVTLPSASTLAVLRGKALERPRGSKAVAVFADPVFEFDDPRVRRKLAEGDGQAGGSTRQSIEVAAFDAFLERSVRDFSNAGFRRLPHTRQEADAIISFTPQPKGKELLDFQADRPAAMSAEMSDYRIIHFATHGLLNSEHPELSGVVLSLVDEGGKSQNGFLRLNEIYNLRLGADLVVISACRTALGKEIRGEGIVGLTRGFMYAGVPRVVASLWAVDDEVTVELMKSFYREMLGGGARPAAALRAAQVNLWRRKRLPPFYWAAFILQGEWK